MLRVCTQAAVAIALACSLEKSAGYTSGPAGRRERDPVAITAVASPRTWHVTPEMLNGLPPDVQVRTISKAAAKAEPGDTVVIHSGTYRETVTIERSGTKDRPIRFEAARGEVAVVTGADAIQQWNK